MSYVKKDEDADQGMIKVDRTSVFQEGTTPNRNIDLRKLKECSTIVQHIPRLSPKMSNSPHQDRTPSLYWGEIPYERSHLSFFWDIQALPE